MTRYLALALLAALLFALAFSGPDHPRCVSLGHQVLGGDCLKGTE